jgi:N-acetyl sugar amidotransferase
MKNKYSICTRCVSDLSIPNIIFDENGECQYCKIHDEMEREYPFNDKSFDNLIQISKKIKIERGNKKFDCVVGISGGRDSSYLLYIVKEILKLNPLAVHYDNGFDSEISTSNILNVCNKLNVELETKVANWETFKKITQSFFKAGVSDPDTPTDIGIFKSMYQTAYDENIKYVFNGHSFRTEGVEPLDWTYMDGLYIKDINKKYGNSDLNKFDNFTLIDLIKFSFVKGIKTILPLNYIRYDHDEVQDILNNKLGWKYYGGHHHESLLTKFVVSYYLPNKFGIDRRRTGLSAMVRSKKIDRQEALQILRVKPKLDDENYLREYILDKLDLTNEQFQDIMNQKNKNFRNFNTYYSYFKNFGFFAKIAYKLGFIPKLLYLRYYGKD